MKYGFLIDHDRCIGCHACTVACKAENAVPVGDFRTWVKYVEKGRFPGVRRHFAVLRCNHCTNAPCVTICPVNALEKRPDGIVDIDRDACIGCRACMQACPYDAIYLNEDLGAVEKCHFCAHRVDKGLEPACVIVCPEQAIVSGDLDDPSSRLSRMIKGNKVQVRRPEQGTGPNVYYKGVEPSALDPGAPSRPPTYLWSDRPADKPDPWPISLPVLADARVVLDAGHKVEWGWPVALYLVTKGIAAGAGILAPFAAMLGLTGAAERLVPELLAIIFTLVTVGLLIEDLARPRVFYRLLTRPNWRSWLVKGGIILAAFGAAAAAALGLRMAGMDGAAAGMRWLEAILGVGAAGYTALLFGQCEGRDLWQSRWLLPSLLAQALMCGGIVLAPMSETPTRCGLTAAAGMLVFLATALFERFGDHETANARQAAAFLGTLRFGPVRAWAGGLVVVVAGVAVGHVVPAAAVVLVLGGLFAYEWAYVRAGQLPPLS
jgi:Fe-S-cluster-containing dehydrogenase component/formate-dependent nitrite reductase membrane component NrfD